MSQALNLVKPKRHKKFAIASLTLGIISLFAWYIPLFGYPIGLAGIIFWVLTVYCCKKMATVGFVLSLIGLILTSSLGFILW